MKIVGIAVVRTGSDLNEPVPLVVANDLSSFGFFQRQVRKLYWMVSLRLVRMCGVRAGVLVPVLSLLLFY